METGISPALRAMMDASPDPWGYGDGNHYVYANQANARIHGIRHHLDMIGMTFSDIPNAIAECSSLYIAQEAYMWETGKSLRTLEIHPCDEDGKWRAFLCDKMPFFDADGKVIAAACHGMELATPTMRQIGDINAESMASGMSYLIDHLPEQPSLPPREAEVLFLLLRCRGIRRIAAIMGLSPRTVEQYLAQLRDKFAVTSKNELIDLAMQRGYLNYIPQSLFTRQLSVILRDR